MASVATLNSGKEIYFCRRSTTWMEKHIWFKERRDLKLRISAERNILVSSIKQKRLVGQSAVQKTNHVRKRRVFNSFLDPTTGSKPIRMTAKFASSPPPHLNYPSKQLVITDCRHSLCGCRAWCCEWLSQRSEHYRRFENRILLL